MLETPKDLVIETALPKGYKRADVSLSSPEKGNRSGFRNVVFTGL
jgi:hypothetical protein